MQAGGRAEDAGLKRERRLRPRDGLALQVCNNTPGALKQEAPGGVVPDLLACAATAGRVLLVEETPAYSAAPVEAAPAAAAAAEAAAGEA